MAKKSVKVRIKDLPKNINLGGVKFHDLKTGIMGYWYSQWGYEGGKVGIWWKKDMKSTEIFPLFLDDLKEALEFEVVGEEKE